MENGKAKNLRALESFGRLCAVDAKECLLVNDLQCEVLPKGQHDCPKTFQQERRGLVTLAYLRCASALPPPAALPAGVEPLSRDHKSGVSLRTWLLKKSVRQRINNCWRPFGSLAEAYVDQEVNFARLEMKTLKEGKTNGSLRKDDRRRLEQLLIHRNNMRTISTILKEIRNPKKVLSEKEQERLETLNNILAGKEAKATAVVEQ